MSVRALGNGLLKHGTALVRLLCKRDINIASNNTARSKLIASTAAPLKVPFSQQSQAAVVRHYGLRNLGAQITLQARKILIDSVLNRVTNSLARDMRKRAARRILYGDSAPFLAFIGVSLASGTGILTKEEELEGVCQEIRGAISKINWNLDSFQTENLNFENEQISTSNFTIGKLIAKGANAAVYTAKASNSQMPEKAENVNEEPKPEQVAATFSEESNLQSVVLNPDKDQQAEPEDGIENFPFALKMMFNYDIQSNSLAILRGMQREIVPARACYNAMSPEGLDILDNSKFLHPHPNIVAMHCVFVDFIPELDQCHGLYPAALPKRLNPDGEGRNMSLFLVMKRYNTNLQNYLSSGTPTVRVSVLLLTQLLEGVAHLSAHQIAHRDLKTDNLLLDTAEPEMPILVISDFGCCLVNQDRGLTLPFTNIDTDRGGNMALMAPEIINQRPGTFAVLDYSKSDLWACGTIAYEIFGLANPFYGSRDTRQLRNVNYKEEELPELPCRVPNTIQALVKNILQRKPRQRLDPETAANVCQLYLWAPSVWIKKKLLKIPSSTEILQWLLTLTTKVLCEGANFKGPHSNVTSSIGGRRTLPEYLLISSFLSRAKLSNIRAALSFIQDNIPENDD